MALGEISVGDDATPIGERTRPYEFANGRRNVTLPMNLICNNDFDAST
jgi:hypothetical protein